MQWKNHPLVSQLNPPEESDSWVCCLCSAQKPAYLVVWGSVSAYWKGSLHIWKGNVNAEMIYTCGRNICSHPFYIFFRKAFESLGMIMLNCILHPVEKHSFIVEAELVCLRSRLFTSWMQLVYWETQDCWAAWILQQTKSVFLNSKIWSLVLNYCQQKPLFCSKNA